MPNNPRRNKQKSRPKSKPRHVADLVQRVLPGRTTGYDTSALPVESSLEWRDFLRAALDPELRPHVRTVLAKPAEIVVFTESAAWCSRLKLALGEMGQLVKARDAKIAKIHVRVMPQGSARDVLGR